jgi:hypothetical protein
MKYEDIVTPIGMTTEQAGIAIGNVTLFLRMIEEGWIKPIVDRNRCRLFDAADVKHCWDRLKLGEYPGEEKARKYRRHAA